MPVGPAVRVLPGDATAIPLPDASVDAAWLSLMIHHVTDFSAMAAELRRVLRPGAPVLIRQGFPGRVDRVELVRWFPETARTVDSYPTVEAICAAFADAGFRQEALVPVRETLAGDLEEFLGQLDVYRQADTTMRHLSEDAFERGRARVRAAVAQDKARQRTNWLDLLVLR